MLILLLALVLEAIALQASSSGSNHPREPRVIPLSRSYKRLTDLSSHTVCRSQVNYFATLNKVRCSEPYTREQLVRTVFSVGAVRCQEGEDCQAKTRCKVKASYRGCTKKSLQDGINAAGFLKFYCKREAPQLVFLIPDQPERTHARCLTDKQYRDHLVAQEALQQSRHRERIIDLLDEAEAEDASTETPQPVLSLGFEEDLNAGFSQLRIECLDLRSDVAEL